MTHILHCTFQERASVRGTGRIFGTGQASHIERFNGALRQRLARFVRKMLSFSKSEVMHEACLRLFLHHCNTQMAPGAPAAQPPN